MLPDQGREMPKDPSWPHPLALAPLPLTLDPRPPPWTPETHTLSGPQNPGLVKPQNPRPVVPTLQEAEAASNTSNVDVDQQLLWELPGGDIFPDVCLPDVCLPIVPLPEQHPDGSVGQESTNPCLHCIFHSLGVIDNARDDPFLFPRILMPTEVHLKQLVTQSYQSSPSWTPSGCTPDESDYSQHAPMHLTCSAS